MTQCKHITNLFSAGHKKTPLRHQAFVSRVKLAVTPVSNDSAVEWGYLSVLAEIGIDVNTMLGRTRKFTPYSCCNIFQSTGVADRPVTCPAVLLNQKRCGYTAHGDEKVSRDKFSKTHNHHSELLMLSPNTFTGAPTHGMRCERSVSPVCTAASRSHSCSLSLSAPASVRLSVSVSIQTERQTGS